ncbi:MAG: flavodoxin domain-containing protein [Clostridia bacterium]|nr:flavodoxin domain-containing protein [Clostridia bacterium]
MDTLIIYATKHGTAEKCAALLSKKLEGKVDIHDIKAGSVLDLTKYGRVVIGGSIYMGRIQKEISTFCTQNINELRDKKLGLYICCMFKNNADAQLNSAFPKELLDIASAKECFGGEMRFSNMNFAERIITKMVSKTIAKDDASLTGIDTKKDVSMLDESSINKFAKLMSEA